MAYNLLKLALISSILHAAAAATDDLELSTHHFDDRFHTFKQIVEENGYIYSSYTVITTDGYHLRLERIQNHESPKGKEPVLLQHGLELSAVEWVLNSPDKSPAFMLVNEGFDVWLGNNRGTDQSLGHDYYSYKSWRYWEFDQEQMGHYDVPAMIDKILEVNGKK